jgi:hypothetical protein
MNDILKNPVCAICGSKDVSKINKHIFYLIDCKNCEHAYALIEEKSLKKFTKKDSLEYSFCPYSNIVKKLRNEQFQVQLCYGSFDNHLCHYFSEKSLRKFLSNLGVDFDLQIEDKTATFTILPRRR